MLLVLNNVQSSRRHLRRRLEQLQLRSRLPWMTISSEAKRGDQAVEKVTE